jgi:3-hydroxyacyl-[acyl-carrier-protein] dehydratase
MNESVIKLPIEVEDIKKMIPHRYPFLLVDRITEVNLGASIVGIRAISGSDPILQGHFPDDPVVPGVMIIEGMAQIAAVLGRLTEQSYSTVLLTEVSQARFRRKVIPGDVITYKIVIGKMRKPFFWFEGEASVDGQPAASALFSARLA